MRFLFMLLLLQVSAQPPVRDSRPDPVPVGAVGTATIAGRITTADTGLPVRRAIVRLGNVSGTDRDTFAGNAGIGRSVFSDPDGRFEFTNLAAGSYVLMAVPSPGRATHLSAGYGMTGADRWQTPVMARPFSLQDGQAFRADLQLPPAAAISGRVVDAAGEPIGRVTVGAVRIVPEGTATAVTAQTDDRGQYRVFGLIPGEYVVHTGGRPQTTGISERPEDDPQGPVPSYAPGVAWLDRASRVRLGPGREATLDIQVLEGRLGTISGTALTSGGAPVKGGVSLTLADLRTGAVFGSVSWSPAGGTFKFERVAPGTYDLIARHQGKSSTPEEMAVMRVELLTADVTDLLLVTQPAAVVVGDIVYDDGISDGRRATLSFLLPSARRTFSLEPRVEMNGTAFTIRGAFEPYLIRGAVTAPADGFALQAVLLNGRDVTDEPRRFSEKDGRVQVVFTSRAPAISGRVTDESGAAIEQALVLLFGEDETSWLPNSTRLRVARPGKDGTFSLKGLRDGQYRVAAIPDDYRFTLAGPDVELLRAIKSAATPVVLNTGDLRTIDLRLHRPGQ